MSDKITNKQVQAFLKDFKENSETVLLESGKETDELFEIAAARGIQLKDNKDLAGVKFIYTFADIANKNRARLPKKELLKALPSMIGKPLDIDHSRNYVIGAFLDYRYIVKDEKVIAYAVVYKSNFADEWEEMQKLFAEGRLTTSYEIWSDHSKRKVLEDGTYELYDMTIAGGAILLRENPAFPGAKVLELAKERMAKQHVDMVYASEYKSEDLIVAEESISQAAELKKDNAAIQSVVEGDKVETKKEEVVATPEVKVEVATVVEVPQVEAPKAEEKLAEASVPPVEEKKTEEPAKAEDSKVIVETKKTEVIEDVKTVGDVTVAEKTITEETKVTEIYQAPVAVESEVVPVISEEVKKIAESLIIVADLPVEEAIKIATEEVKIAEVVVETPKVVEPVVEAKAQDMQPCEPKEEEKEPEECKKCKENAGKIEELEKQVKWYKENAAEIAKRRSELLSFAAELSDAEILDNTKFADAKVVKANSEIVKSEVVGVKATDEDTYKKYRDEIQAKAEGKIKRTH